MKIKGTNISITHHEPLEEHKRLAKEYKHLNHKIIGTPKDSRSQRTISLPVELFLDLTEGMGYWKEGTALQTLLEMGKLQTPFYTYTIIK
tara:strand:+ start:200 stop:469 length:270 start_codon:yes stop_codon:yes gene_type:complete